MILEQEERSGRVVSYEENCFANISALSLKSQFSHLSQVESSSENIAASSLDKSPE